MTIKLSVAVDQGGAIGWSDGRMPWRLPADMKRFKELTTGSTVVMGFNTFKSIGRPQGLPNRRNIVVTRKPWSEARTHFDPSCDVDVISSLDWLRTTSICSLWIIGGASVYEEALSKDMVDEIYLTLVHTDSGADVRMTTDLVAWKRFVITQRANGINWEAEPISRQWDGNLETSYITFRKT